MNAESAWANFYILLHELAEELRAMMDAAQQPTATPSEPEPETSKADDKV